MIKYKPGYVRGASWPEADMMLMLWLTAHGWTYRSTAKFIKEITGRPCTRSSIAGVVFKSRELRG